MPTPFDDDRQPDRFRLASRVTSRHLTASRSLYARLAEVLAELDARRILDIGCGEGALRAALPVRTGADAAALPVRTGAVDAAVAVNVLDHLADPSAAVAEAHRVLAHGGVFLAAAASRHDSPELAAAWRPPPSGFDAEDGPGLVASVFAQVEVERWDAPLIRLPDREAVRDYLIARFVAPEDATAAADQVPTPLAVPKRGALIRARR
jgi:cyclopropane fatty-acyl-phospholipid synthase-like methyltransferase